MKKVLLAMSLSAALMFAQFGPGGTNGGPNGANAQPSFTELKAALGITDAQVNSLTLIRQAEATAMQPIATQIQSKQQALQTSLMNGTTALAAGTALLEIEGLRKQMTAIQTNARNQATGVLSADQRTKLAALDAAAKLQPAAQQAQALNLLAPAANTTSGGLGGGRGPRGFAPPEDAQ